MLEFCQNWIFGQKFDFSNSVQKRRMDSTQLLPNALECVRNRCIRLASLHPYWFLAWTRHSYCASGTRSANRNFFSWWNSFVLASPGMMILVQSLPPAMFKPIPSFCKIKEIIQYVYLVGWHDYSKMLKNMLQNLLVVPMGTQTYDKKFERDRTHPQLAIGHSIFSTIS